MGVSVTDSSSLHLEWSTEAGQVQIQGPVTKHRHDYGLHQIPGLGSVIPAGQAGLALLEPSLRVRPKTTGQRAQLVYVQGGQVPVQVWRNTGGAARIHSRMYF